jgi:Signal transduction histidine kinase
MLVQAPLKRLLESFSEVLTPKEEYQHKVLTNIYKQTKDMKNAVDLIFDIDSVINKENQVQKKPYPLNHWVQSIADDFRMEFEDKGIRLVYQLDKSIKQICFDERKCKIALSNYLMNALDFSFPKTSVTISTSIHDRYVRVAVSDQGIGLCNTDINKLFTRFYQGKHDRNGYGIGLSYAKVLIEMHKGRVGAYNNPQKGATFYYELPIDTNETISETTTLFLDEYHLPHLSEKESFPTNNYSIVIVEDNIDLLNFMKDDLKALFKKVYTATDGEKALTIIKDKLPDIIVSDIMMPHMDGYELCEKVKRTIEISHIPVILLTARTDQNSLSLGYKIGADAYLAKPFEMDILINIIHNQMKTREQIKILYQGRQISNPSIEKHITNNVDEQFLKKLNALIMENLNYAQLDVPFLIKNMGMSRTPLYKKIKELTGLGVNDYVNHLRVNKAEELLLTTDMTITEIAETTGFTYQRYFSSIFKKQKGLAPSQFREKAQKKPSKSI